MKLASARVRVLARAFLLFALALALRIPFLGEVPAPSGDEGNWSTFGLAIVRGHAPAIARDAGFVSPLYAQLIAIAYRLHGVSFASARLVASLSVALSCALTYALARRVGASRAGFIAALLLALHPWSVAWSRSASVPYALAFALLVPALLVTALALRTRRTAPVLFAPQLFSLGVHFSPLIACALPGVLMYALSRGLTGLMRTRARSVFVAVALALVHPAFVLTGARAALAATPAPTRPLAYLGARLAVYLRVCVELLSGQATVAHFTPLEVSRVLRAACGIACLAALAASLTQRTRLARLGALTTLSSALALPLLLARGRPWHLGTVDAERYGFVLVAPFVLVVGALVASPRRGCRALGLLAFCAIVACATVPLLVGALGYGGPDRGLSVRENGGAYRGHRSIARASSLAEQAVACARAHAQGPALLVYRDYAFHAVGLAMYRDDPAGVLRRARALDGASHARRAERLYVLVWHPSVFAPTFSPRASIEENQTLRARAVSAAGARRICAWSQRDGSPLAELWHLPVEPAVL